VSKSLFRSGIRGARGPDDLLLGHVLPPRTPLYLRPVAARSGEGARQLFPHRSDDMKNRAALVSTSLVFSVFVLATCAQGSDTIFDEDDDDSGQGGSAATGSGAGGNGATGSSSSGMASSSSGMGSSSSGMGSSSSGSGSGSGGAGGEGGAGGAVGAGGAPIVDCANIPQGPFSYTVKLGQKAGEDMDFDDAGNVVGAESGNLFKSTFNGQSQIWVPGIGSTAGIRFTSEGILVYADVGSNALFRIDPPATKAFVVGGLAYPNGMDADDKGNMTVAEQSASQVRRVNPLTGDFQILAQGLNNPNGVSYSPDYKTIYVGSFGGGIIYRISLDAQDNPVSQDILAQNFSGGAFDGMGVDACGNVYVCEYIAAKVWRIPPNGQNPHVIVDLSAETGWIPNMQWGSGVGGWDPLVLYVRDISSGRMFEVPVGVPSKPRKYP
jgi:streptogramin lyase